MESSPTRLESATATAPAAADQTAAGVRWDLSHIFPDIAAARISLDGALRRAEEFESAFRGKVKDLEGESLASALDQLGAIRNDFSRVDQYADLRFSIDSRDVETKDLMDSCARAHEDIQNRLRFLDLEWQALPADLAQSRSSDPSVRRYRHVLERLTAYAPHMRSEQEEAMLAARETAAIAEWQKLFSENEIG